MDSVDLKGIAWVGNVYQKFEAMCLEVEETMYQETAKYVENQVQTMGASMKRFYSDVMQDLHPPSSTDPVKVAGADLLLNTYTDFGILKKPKENVKEHTKKIVRVKGFSEKDSSPPSERSYLSNDVSNDNSPALPIGGVSEKNDAVRDEIVEISHLASVEVVRGEYREAEEGKVCNSSLDADVVSDDASTATAASGTVLLIESSVKKGKKLGHISATGILSAESNETCEDCQLISQIDSHSSGDMQFDQLANGEVYVSHTGDCNMDTIENDDTRDPRTENTGESSRSNLEDTCVLVVGENVDSDSSSQRKNRSYKKKIRQAFSLKMKSARKQEHEQLAAEYVNTNTRSNLESVGTEMPTLAMNSNSKTFETHDFSESDWELL